MATCSLLDPRGTTLRRSLTVLGATADRLASPSNRPAIALNRAG